MVKEPSLISPLCTDNSILGVEKSRKRFSLLNSPANILSTALSTFVAPFPYPPEDRQSFRPEKIRAQGCCLKAKMSMIN
jgi:hypothetical protein